MGDWFLRQKADRRLPVAKGKRGVYFLYNNKYFDDTINERHSSLKPSHLY